MKLISTAVYQQHRVTRNLFSAKGVDDLENLRSALYSLVVAAFIDRLLKIGIYAVYSDKVRLSL